MGGEGVNTILAKRMVRSGGRGGVVPPQQKQYYFKDSLIAMADNIFLLHLTQVYMALIQYISVYMDSFKALSYMAVCSFVFV